MLLDIRRSIVSLVAMTWIAAAPCARTAESQLPKPAAASVADSQAQADLCRLIAGILSDTSSHMRMGPTRKATLADSTRAAAVVLAARAETDAPSRNGPPPD